LLEFNIDAETAPPKIIGAIISKWKDMALVPEKVSQSDIKSNYHNIARNVYKTYQSKLVESNTLDFGDLILYNVQIFLQNPDILEHYQNKYKYILIDEYQDTNPVQYIWTRMLASKYNNICCVGDDDQSIYSWRGAEIGNILKFEKDFKDSQDHKIRTKL
jgi:DNA helicase-2/ATP-dependent DNA helicase PcrA